VDIDEALARLEIQDVLWTYARGVDRADYETMASVYHPDGKDHHSHFDGLGTDFAREFADRHADTSGVGQHHITNMSVKMDGENDARVESYFLAFHPHEEDGTPRFGVAAGRYLDHFQRRDGKWKILDRQVVMDWTRDDFGGPPWAYSDGKPLQGRPKRLGDESYSFFDAEVATSGSVTGSN
jgi:SnoaL-like domain